MSRGAPPGGRVLMYLSALAGVVAMVGMWNFFSGRQAEALPLPLVVAVGRFETLDGTGAGPGLELQARLLEQLSRYPGLRVLERSHQETSGGDGAHFLLDGTLRLRNPGWDLTVRLRDLDEDRVLWSDAFPLASQDVEPARDRVVRGLARALKVQPR